MDLEEHPGRQPGTRTARSTRIIARLIRSAAEPWITALTAVRSARLRFRPVVFLIPLIGRRRPRIVSTRPVSRADSSVCVHERLDARVFAEIGVDERGGLGLGDPEPAGQAERA